MKFSTETLDHKRERLEAWHDFFAIVPREVAPGDFRFLELIERRGEYITPKGPPVGSFWRWKYRSKKDPFEPEPVKTQKPPPRDGSMRIVVGAPSTT